MGAWGGWGASLQQGLVEQQGPGRGALLLQTEDEVPEVDSCDPRTELLARGAPPRRVTGAGARGHLDGGGAEQKHGEARPEGCSHTRGPFHTQP